MDAFFAFARERYAIMLRRRAWAMDSKPIGSPAHAPDGAPWTEDLILRKYRFCNVFREDDKTTAWFREKVRGPLAGHSSVMMATIIFRWFNRITTGEVLLEHNLFQDWNAARARAVLKNLKPLITGAYVIRTPTGMNKLEGLIALIDPIWRERATLYTTLTPYEKRTLQGACLELQSLSGLGSFMAYEIVTDLRHTHMLNSANDIDTWANPGPGAARGLGHVLFSDPEEFRYDAAMDAARLLGGMQHLLALSRYNHHWPNVWPAWEMREVEHTLCEFAKYRGAQAGRKLKQRFS